MSLESQCDKGCPQGSNPGPFFWNLVANSLLELDLWQYVKVIAYADDVAVLAKAPNAYICDRRENALAKIALWAELQKLTFSGEKTIMVYFQKMVRLGSYKRNPKTPPRESFFGKAIKAQQSARYLGIIVDDKLKGMAHYACDKQSLANYVRATYSLSRRHWHLNGEVLKRLYKGGIDRQATYGCSFWWTGTGRRRDSRLIIER